MNFLRKLIPTAIAAMVATAIIGASTASATTLEIGGATQNKSVHFTFSLVSGSSTIAKDTNNLTIDTCKTSTITGQTETPFTGPTVTATAITTTFSGCSHKTIVISQGKFHFAWLFGTNGAVASSGAEWTIESTIFGISCIAKTGTGTTIGTITGVASGKATIDINGVIPMGACGDVNMTGTYTVTSPEGLGIEN